MSKNSNYLTLPNIITFFGIISCFFLFFVQNNLLAFLFLFIVMASDLLDGFLARKMNQKTEIGKNLDTIRDLLFLTYMLIGFSEKVGVNIIAPMYILQIFLLYLASMQKTSWRYHMPHKYAMAIYYILSYIFLIFGFEEKIFLRYAYPLIMAYLITLTSFYFFLKSNITKKAAD